jgi:hypothetical protein
MVLRPISQAGLPAGLAVLSWSDETPLFSGAGGYTVTNNRTSDERGAEGC